MANVFTILCDINFLLSICIFKVHECMLLVSKITIDIFYYILQNTLSYRGFSGKLYNVIDVRARQVYFVIEHVPQSFS